MVRDYTWRQQYIRCLTTKSLVEAIEHAEERAEADDVWADIHHDLTRELTIRTMQHGGMAPPSDSTGND